MTDPTNPTLPRQTSVAQIENQLREVWRELGEQHTNDGHAVTRVCTLTLVSYGGTSEHAKRIRSAVPSIFEQHPARAITIEADGAADELSAWVSAVCLPSTSDKEQMCCEQITLNVGEHMRQRLPSLVFPFVVSDLPMFVWYPGPLNLESNVHNQLFAHSDRWIVDSNDFADPLGDLAKLNGLIKSDPSVAVSDMTWVRLTTWRTTFAQIFDAQDMQTTLDTIDSVTIATGSHPAAELLSLGWLASRLNWQLSAAHFDEANTLRCTFQRNGQPIQVAISDTHPEIPASSMMVKSQIANTTITIERNRQKRALTAKIDFGTHQRAKTSEYTVLTDGDILNTELAMFAHDRVYEQALAVVADIKNRSKK